MRAGQYVPNLQGAGSFGINIGGGCGSLLARQEKEALKVIK